MLGLLHTDNVPRPPLKHIPKRIGARCRASGLGLAIPRQRRKIESMTMRLPRPAWLAAGLALLLNVAGAVGQGTFQNLNFENTTLTVTLINPWGPYYATNATVPGWAWSPQQTFGFGDPNTTVAFNNMALDAAAVTLHGPGSFEPVLSGNYSILLQGGSQYLGAAPVVESP